MYTYTYTNKHTCKHGFTQVYLCIHTKMLAYMQTDVSTYVHARMHAYMLHANIHVCINAYIYMQNTQAIFRIHAWRAKTHTHLVRHLVRQDDRSACIWHCCVQRLQQDHCQAGTGASLLACDEGSHPHPATNKHTSTHIVQRVRARQECSFPLNQILVIVQRTKFNTHACSNSNAAPRLNIRIRTQTRTYTRTGPVASLASDIERLFASRLLCLHTNIECLKQMKDHRKQWEKLYTSRTNLRKARWWTQAEACAMNVREPSRESRERTRASESAWGKGHRWSLMYSTASVCTHIRFGFLMNCRCTLTRPCGWSSYPRMGGPQVEGWHLFFLQLILILLDFPPHVDTNNWRHSAQALNSELLVLWIFV